ncbi:glycosyltransferase family 2 protein [Solwaraspora sp. WMMB335]|uniref:glycosyltransferase family 2 protein n=1 Tax=Solwaraspora sp. WMMB335 TaxID=3404118 RepID=UPI003B93D702
MNSDRSASNGRLTSKSVVVAPVPGVTGEPPTVSVIIPCYNYGHFLPESVPSALSQEGVQVEVIIVDDASTDDSAAVAEKFAGADPRVRVVRHQKNTGHVVAFNDGLAEASGAYIHRLDADDLLTPGALARAVALFEHQPSVGLVYGHPSHFTTSPPPPARTQVRSWTIWSGGDWIAERCRRGVNCITTPEAVVRASVVEQIGPLSLRLKFAQDMEYWLRVAAVSDVGRIDGADQAWHRDHAASMSVTTGAGQLLDLRERRTVFETVFDGPGGRFSDATAMHRTARRALAGEALQIASHAYDRGRTAEVDVDSFIAFARETFADYQQLPQWRALQRRSRVGARLAPVVPPFAASVVWRRVQREVRYRRWVRAGV